MVDAAGTGWYGRAAEGTASQTLRRTGYRRMKEDLPCLLECPDCRGEISLRGADRCDAAAAREIETGTLGCDGCGRTFRIERGVPDFVGGSLDDECSRVAESFGRQWNHFQHLYDDPSHPRRQFLDWVRPLGPSDFEGKVVLEAGCGMGRWLDLVATFGPARIVGVDFSTAAFAAQTRARELPNVHVVRADLRRLPLKRAFDLSFSLGVYHHMPDPFEGILGTVRVVRPGGRVQLWVYGLENNEWIVRWVSPVRERVTSRLRPETLRTVTLAASAAAYPLLAGLDRLGNTGPAGDRLAAAVPYSPYLRWLGRWGFRHMHHVVYDHLSPAIAHYVPRETVASWMERAALDDVEITPRNENSWRAIGTVPKPPGGG